MKTLKITEQDFNSKGKKVSWEIELWEWTTFLKNDTIVTWKTSTTKVAAQQWIQEKLLQQLVLTVKVVRLTYDKTVPNTSFLMPTRKLMLHQEY